MTPPIPSRRLEVDREDLMREATALRQRAEFRLADEPETVVAGYRRDGSLSVYFGPDPCFHFDAEGRLRRAFVGGILFRTQGETIARLHRVRSDEAVELQRYDLSPDERDQFLSQVRHRLTSFANALRSQTSECLREIPDDSHLAEQLVSDFSRLLSNPLTLAPVIPGKQ